MAQRAFTVIDSAKDLFVDASVTVSSDGNWAAVGQRLTEGNGYIITEDELEIQAFSNDPVLKTVSVEEALAAQGG